MLKFRNKATTLRTAEILIMILLIRCCTGVKKEFLIPIKMTCRDPFPTTTMVESAKNR